MRLPIRLFACFAAFGFPAIAQSAGMSVEGPWVTEGYGELLNFRSNAVDIFEITGKTCVFESSAKKHPTSRAGELEFENMADGTMRVTSGNTRDKLWLHSGGVTSIALQRLPAFPENCARKIANTPESNYQVFWQTFAEQYPFFTLHGVNWTEIDRKFRTQVSPATTPAELFAILQQMIQPLGDAHTGIDAKSIHKQFNGYRRDADPPSGKLIRRVHEIIQQKYGHGTFQDYCHEFYLGSAPRSLLHFGLVTETIGYLRVDEFPQHCENDLDRLFSRASELKGLIVDLRLNSGGSDAFGIALASRLTNRPYLAYSKVARNDTQDTGHRTAPQRVMVQPAQRPGYTGDIALLMGRDTVSAAEVFAMALFGRTPRVTKLGDNTQGVFSDVLERKLPNGWIFRLPNELYLAEDERSFDMVGVPPDVRVPVFPESDLQQGRDNGLEKAIELLASRH